MRLSVDISPSIARAMRQDTRDMKDAVTRAMRSSGADVKRRWRADIAANLSRRLAGAARVETYPKGASSASAAMLAYTKSPELFYAHETGATIRSSEGFYLAIPLPAAGKGKRGRRITPAEFEARRGVRLRFVYRRPYSFLYAEGRLSGGKRSAGQFRVSRSKTGRGLTSIPVFVLVPRVKLRKRLNLGATFEAVADDFPSRLVAQWVLRKVR